ARMYQRATKQGWHIKEAKYSPEAFGDALVDLESRDFNIRITRDRSQIFIYVSRPESSHWYDLVALLGDDFKDNHNLFSENTVVNLLERNLLKIPALLMKNRTWV